MTWAREIVDNVVTTKNERLQVFIARSSPYLISFIFIQQTGHAFFPFFGYLLISACVWIIVFKIIVNWSRRRLHVHRRRRLHCHRYWYYKFWENVIFCCRRSVWVAYHGLWFFTGTLICIHTIFLSRYHCWKENKGPTIFRGKSKLLMQLKFLPFSISTIFLFHRRTYQCSYKASFECLQIQARTETYGHTKICLQSQTRIHLFTQKRAHKDTEEKLHVHATHTHLHIQRRAHRDARRYKRSHTQKHAFFCISRVRDYSLFSYLWLRKYSESVFLSSPSYSCVDPNFTENKSRNKKVESSRQCVMTFKWYVFRRKLVVLTLTS